MATCSLVGSPWLRIRVFPAELPPSFLRSRLAAVRRRNLSISASGGGGGGGPVDDEVRVRFAPSPTGNLHVGGARTALFNYLFARSKGGKFVLRIEDTDLERSTKQSEEAVLRDLSWLGLDWDEGPDIGGEYGPYRQSERNSLYKLYAEKLLESGAAYRCFCPNEELEQMKETAKQMQLPPVYMGKWATASEAEVQEELEKGTPYTYRFRVPKEGTLKISDLIRGEVSWSLDTLGDFVVMRSNGQPVYNFCVTIDDANMHISHVIRAEEHLPNTLRQALIYKALGFPMPSFAHVSLILAPDRSKLSKRHGATSVGQFREMGYLPQAMVNYLALLGWGDGTENEFFTIDQLVEKFSINRVNKSGAVFDLAKLRWMNGQHLRLLPSDELIKIFEDRWKCTGILQESESSFTKEATELLKDGIDLITDADVALSNLLSYPLHATLNRSIEPYNRLKMHAMLNSLSTCSCLLATSCLISVFWVAWWLVACSFKCILVLLLIVLYLGFFVWNLRLQTKAYVGSITSIMLVYLLSRTILMTLHKYYAAHMCAISSVEGKPIVQDKLSEVAASLISAYDSGELRAALDEGHAGWQKWVKSFGKSLKRKGKLLFMPLRVLLTGKLHGPDMGGSILLIYKAGLSGAVTPQSGFVNLDGRFKILKEVDWELLLKESESQTESVVSKAH